MREELLCMAATIVAYSSTGRLEATDMHYTFGADTLAPAAGCSPGQMRGVRLLAGVVRASDG